MGDLPPRPAGSKIQVEVSGDSLRVTIPGRWTLAFWASLLFAFLFTAVAVIFIGSPQRDPLSWVLPGWGVLCFVWFFFVFKARTETVTLDRDHLETRGCFRPFVRKKLRTEHLLAFVMKPVAPRHLWQGTLVHEGFGRRKLLFAEAVPGASPPDLALAIQAENAEMEWLRGVFEDHHRMLRPA